MEKTLEIHSCGHQCVFYTNTMDGMQCDHPYWADKNNWGENGAYSNMIITQDHIHEDGKMPKECPLRKEDLTLHFKLKI